MEEETGKYYMDCAVGAAAPQGEDKKQAKKLWEVSKGIVADITLWQQRRRQPEELLYESGL